MASQNLNIKETPLDGIQEDINSDKINNSEILTETGEDDNKKICERDADNSFKEVCTKNEENPTNADVLKNTKKENKKGNSEDVLKTTKNENEKSNSDKKNNKNTNESSDLTNVECNTEQLDSTEKDNTHTEPENNTVSQNVLPITGFPIVPSIDTLKENVLSLIGSYQNLENNMDHLKLDASCQTDFNSHRFGAFKEELMRSKSNENPPVQVLTSSSESITAKCHSQDDISYIGDVEIRKKKRLNITVALRNSFNGKKLRNSFRNRKCRSESPDIEGKKLGKTLKDFATGMTSLILQPQKAITEPLENPPAPLLVEDPPTDNEGGEGDIKNLNLSHGSSGNFNSAGSSGVNSGVLQSTATGPAARSAPSTPQTLLATTPGATDAPPASPSAIHKSPSQAVFSKVDKTNLKLLSTSTPAMTAQGQLAEPPSPKAVKDPKVHITSKARQKKFLRHFPNVEEDEKVLNHYSCALIGDILLQGHLYITKNYFAFYSNVFGYVTKLLIPILTVEDITKEKTARIIPNAVGVMTLDDKHIFGSLMSRDSTLAYMRTVWQKAKSEEVIPEPEIVEPEDQDSSESCESGRDSPIAELAVSSSPLSTPTFALMRKVTKDAAVRNATDQGVLLERKGSRGFIRTLKDAIAEFRKLPRQNLILVATTLLLVLLFLSAAVLLYRINRIQNRFSLSLQEGSFSNNNGGDIYSNLLRWQAHLHSKSADAVNNLLDSNLDQISKVRQSLEALSMLLTQSEEESENDSPNLTIQDGQTVSPVNQKS